jgi:hypothetical protein
LSDLIAGEEDGSRPIERDSAGAILLDADPDAFEHILAWLRLGALSRELPAHLLTRVQLQAKQLGLKRLVAAVGQPDLPLSTDPEWLSRLENAIYAIGGYNFNNVTLATVERYDPRADRWMAVASMPTARSSLAAAVVEKLL